MIIKNLWLIGEIEYADYLLTELEKRLPFMTDDEWSNKAQFDYEFQLSKQLDISEHWIMSDCISPCEECAKYRNRIYSYSGNDKRFPQLPDVFKQGKYVCKNHCCHLSSILYYDDFDMERSVYTSFDNLKTIKLDPIKHSNRPFIDDRNECEIQHYEEHKAELEKRKQAEDRYYDRNYWIGEYSKHLEYQNIVDVLGEKSSPKVIADICA